VRRHDYAGREELQIILGFFRPGDVRMVTRIDRLARSITTCRTSCLQ
jgi:DNA invertase Pin-like site-specific DNA recombinase